jgi:ATP/maltotriose-dependent transcriptional regulator MalT
LQDALQIATSAQLVALRLSLIVDIGRLLLEIGRQEAGLEALLFVRQHPAATRESQERARRLLEPYHGQLAHHTSKHRQSYDLETLTARLQAQLADLRTQPDAGSPVGHAAQPSAQPLIEPLTPREHELLQLLAAGLSYQEIAERLTIAVGSVKSHSHHIYAKLGVRNRIQAASRAAELGLL